MGRSPQGVSSLTKLTLISVFFIISLSLVCCQQTSKKLILFREQTVRVTPAIIGANAAKLDKSLPFNGFSVFLPESYSVFTSNSFDTEAMRTTLSSAFVDPATGLLKFTRLVDDWALINILNPGSMYDDAAWNTVVDHWREFAKAAKDTLVGIMFDNEEYQSKWSDSFPVTPLVSDLKKFYEYSNKTFERGTQIMNAVLEVWPNVKVMFLHGPYASAPGTPFYVVRNQVGEWNTDSHVLKGVFFAGFLNAIYLSGNTQAELIDGGEVYQYRTLSDFQMSYTWRKTGIADDPQTWFIPSAELRAFWKQRVSISFGTYNIPWPNKKKDKMNAKIMKSTLINALTVADTVVWYYEAETNFLLGTTPKSWTKAVRDALSSVQQ